MPGIPTVPECSTASTLWNEQVLFHDVRNTGRGFGVIWYFILWQFPSHDSVLFHLLLITLFSYHLDFFLDFRDKTLKKHLIWISYLTSVNNALLLNNVKMKVAAHLRSDISVGMVFGDKNLFCSLAYFRPQSMRRRISRPLRGRMDSRSHQEAWRDSWSAADGVFIAPPDTQNNHSGSVCNTCRHFSQLRLIKHEIFRKGT